MYSLEAPQWGTSNEYPQCMFFCGKIRKHIYLHMFLIWSNEQLMHNGKTYFMSCINSIDPDHFVQLHRLISIYVVQHILYTRSLYRRTIKNHGQTAQMWEYVGFFHSNFCSFLVPVLIIMSWSHQLLAQLCPLVVICPIGY